MNNCPLTPCSTCLEWWRDADVAEATILLHNGQCDGPLVLPDPGPWVLPEQAALALKELEAVVAHFRDAAHVRRTLAFPRAHHLRK